MKLRHYYTYGSLLIILVVALILSRIIMNAKMIKNLAATNSNVKAFLLTLRHCEGTAGQRGYNTIMGYCEFDDFSKHPNRKCADKPGYSTAAGAYQFIYSTWSHLAATLALSDFSPASQDAAAVELIRQCGALDDVIAGRIQQACVKLRTQWESLPYGLTTQPHKSLAAVNTYFTAAGGKLA